MTTTGVDLDREPLTQWLDGLPAGWDVARLHRLFKVVNGATPSSREPSYWGGDVTWVTPDDLGSLADGRINEGRRSLTREGYESCGAKIVPPGSLILSTRAPIGYVAIAESSLCTNQGCRALVPRSAANERYYRYVLETARPELEVLGQGATFVELSSSDLSEFWLPVPSHEVQRAIAEFLDEKTAGIDRIVKDKKRLIGSLEEARHSLIHDRVTRGLAPGASTKDSGVPWIGRAPEHWDTKKLRYMAECLDRKRIPLNSSERADMQGQYPYWGANGIVDHVDDWLFDEELVLLGEDGAPFFDPHKPVARFVTGKIWVNNHAHVLRARSDTDPRFLAYALNAVDYADYIKGSTRDKLVQAEMNEIRLPAPPLAEQTKIADVLDDEDGEIDGLIEDLKEQLSSLEEYRTSLITAAVIGRIDVRASTPAVA